jgi:PAP2 superfamily protein
MKRTLLLCALSAVIALGGALAMPVAGLGKAEPAKPNVVIDWNHTMLATLAAANVPAPPAVRYAAIVQAAVFDAVNGIDRRYTPIHVAPAAPRGASRQAAAVAAAYTALVSLFSAQTLSLDAARAASMASLAGDDDSQSIARGVQWGTTVANQIVTWRSTDGFSATLGTYPIVNAPGHWQPTPPAFSTNPVFRTLAITTPVAMTSPSEFRPAGPPALTSARYTADFSEVKAWGGLTGSLRTPYQTETAKVWQLDTATAIWNRVADSLAVERDMGLLASARLLAMLNVSQLDAVIAVWEAKQFFDRWRPITAIQQAASDGNPDTSPDVNWAPLLGTPVHQEYPSGHSGVSGAAGTVLAAFFGERTAFTVTSNGVPGASRSFTTFSDAVAQVADARVFAGFHFRFSCDDASQMGTEAANLALTKLMLRNREQGEGSEAND